MSQPQGEPGRLTQIYPSAEPPLGAEPGSGSGRKISGQLAPAAPSSETSEQNVPGWELERSLLLAADLQKTYGTPKTVPPGSSPPHRRPMKESASTERFLALANGELFPAWGVLALASGNGKFHPESGGNLFHWPKSVLSQ